MGYSKQVHKQAREILATRRNSARQDAALRRAQAAQRIPQISGIEQSMRDTAAKVVRCVSLPPAQAKTAVAQLAAQNLALQEQRRALLLQAGYPSDYLNEKPVCADCGDTGHVGVGICHCLKLLLRELSAKELSAGVQIKTFAGFDLSFYPDRAIDDTGVIPRVRMAEILEYCKRYAESFSQSSPSLLFAGRTGLGKTHLSLAIAVGVVEQGFSVLYTPTQKLLDRLEAEKFSNKPDSKERYAETLQAALECDLLVLDDLGAEFATQFTQSTLYNIVNSRLMDGRPTIATTNLEPKEIEARYSQRMLSRLMLDYKVLQFSGTDIRYLRRARQSRS
jgi:DNA replication protein